MRRSRPFSGPSWASKTALSFLISVSFKVPGSFPAAGDDRISRAGFSLTHPDSTQNPKNDRRADFVRLMLMGFRGRLSGFSNTPSEVRNRARSSGFILLTL